MIFAWEKKKNYCCRNCHQKFIFLNVLFHFLYRVEFWYSRTYHYVRPGTSCSSKVKNNTYHRDKQWCFDSTISQVRAMAESIQSLM